MQYQGELEEVKELIRNATLKKTRQFFSRNDIDIEPTPRSEVPVFGHWMSIIMIGGGSLRITLKTQYGHRAIREIGSEKQINENTDISSVMKELSNVVGGFIKQVLESKGFKLGMSLPLTTHGFDEVFYSIYSNSNIYKDSWDFKCSDYSISYSVIIEVYDRETHELLKGVPTSLDSDESGDVQFL